MIDGDDETTGYDLLWVRGRPAATPDLERIAEAVFGPTSETSIANPFGEARPDTPPQSRS